MEKLDIKKVEAFVNSNIVDFHKKRLERLNKLNLNNVLLKKNPYLFGAKNLTIASELIKSLLDAMLSSSEEKFFGDFLEELAIFVAGETCKGIKASSKGIDLEFMNKGVRYLVSIKSGPNWGNDSQQKKQIQDFNNAVGVIKQSKKSPNVHPVLGICYGKTRTSYLHGYMKITGQSFWHFISNNRNLYKDIVEPLGFRAKRHNDSFIKKRDSIINKFAFEFSERFCKDGVINWKKLVEFNSSNMTTKTKK